jgi:hypothetical protein
MNGKTSNNRGLRRAGGLAVMAALAGLATGCGSSAPSSDSSAASADSYVFGGPVTTTQELALAQCMRSHGAPRFPDPSPSGSFTLTTTPNGPEGAVDIDSSRIVAAYGACRHLLTGGGPSIAELRQHLRQQQQKQQEAVPALVNFTRCMRGHGVPDFPVPPADGQTTPAPHQSTGINATSPRFQAAVRACQHVLPAGAHISIQAHASVSTRRS